MSDGDILGTEFQAEFQAEFGAEVEVQVAPAFAGDVGVAGLSSAVEKVLRWEDRPGDVTVVVTDEQGIRELNRDFLGHDRVTDVLAFATQEEGGPFVPAPGTENYLGDVIVCYPRAVEQALEHDHSVQEELALLVVHGMLHLLGYDHATEGEQAAMWALQDEILDQL
jgi:probable rRNA maturation factor